MPSISQDITRCKQTRLTATCSHSCQTSDKTTATYKSIPSTQILTRPSIGTNPLTYLNWVRHDINVTWMEHKQMEKHTWSHLRTSGSHTEPWMLHCWACAYARIECFVIFMYNKGCSAAGVIAATIRHQLFTTGCKLHSILPSHNVQACKASAITG